MGGFTLASDVSAEPQGDSAALRQFLRHACGLPTERVPLSPRSVGKTVGEGFTLERLVYTTEPCSKVPAHLYLPRPRRGRVPAIVIAHGHGGSKSMFASQHAGQLYAKAGFAVLATDPLGEEERDPDGRLGTRTHDRISEEAQTLGRPVVGKMVWDLMCGIDYLQTRREIDPQRIYVVGYSLGAIVGMYTAALDERVRGAALCAMYFISAPGEKFCTRGMYGLIQERLDYAHLLAMAAPRCAGLIIVGDDDAICGGRKVYEQGFKPFAVQARELFAQAGAPDALHTLVVPDAGHRPYYLTREAVLWLGEEAALPKRRLEMVREWRELRLGDWAAANGVEFERLYATEDHYPALLAVDAGVEHVEPAKLACLSDDERRNPEFTAEGWLECVRRANIEEEHG